MKNCKKENNILYLIAKKATEFGWITLERQQEIIDKLEKDTLTIGVIGQMKCGKSTFLNSFVFEDDILPAATTPMTAALSVITYGEEKKDSSRILYSRRNGRNRSCKLLVLRMKCKEIHWKNPRLKAAKEIG